MRCGIRRAILQLSRSSRLRFFNQESRLSKLRIQLARMEADERPSKKRRVSTEDSTIVGTKGAFSAMATKASEAIEDAAKSTPPPTNQDDVDLEIADHESVDEELEVLLPADEGSELPPPSTTAPYASALLNDPNHPPMSKNQQKKLRKKAEWESHREDRKALRKEKALAKRSRHREARQTLESENLALGISVPAPRKAPPQRPVTLPVTILIDCDFDDLMRDNERISLAAQVTRSYSDNKNALFRAHLAVCSFGGKLRERFEGVLGHYRMWRGVRFVKEGFVEAAALAGGWMGDEKYGGVLKGAFEGLGGEGNGNGDGEEGDEAVREKFKQEGEVVYLTSESENTLDRLRPYSTYIIGGLVDKNREKGICYKRARAAGVKTARLPIGEFMEMQGRKVLATNHVNEILVKWLECGDWGKAFLSVIPKRKGGKLKGAVEGEEEGGEVGDEAEDEDEDADGHSSKPADVVEQDGQTGIDDTATENVNGLNGAEATRDGPNGIPQDAQNKA